jgi:hypothetical protein
VSIPVTRRALTALLALTTASVVLAAAASPARAKVPDGFYGVATQALFTEEEWGLMQNAGVEHLRAQTSWTIVQTEPGNCQASAQVGVCDWRYYDFLIGETAEHGLEYFPYFLNVPLFVANDPETPPVRTKEARAGWTDFVDAVVKRYGPGGAFWETIYPIEHPLADPIPITRWQIWNEPSAEPFWHPKAKPREYAKLVRITSNAIRAVDPDAYIVLAGLFGTPTVGIDQPEYLRALYKTPNFERYFDAIAIHPYGPDLDRVRFQVKWALDELERAGDRKAEMWISEIGWASDHLHNQLGVGRKGPARMLERGYERFRK